MVSSLVSRKGAPLIYALISYKLSSNYLQELLFSLFLFLSLTVILPIPCQWNLSHGRTFINYFVLSQVCVAVSQYDEFSQSSYGTAVRKSVPL